MSDVLTDLLGLAIICVAALFIAYPLLRARRGLLDATADGARDLQRQRDTLYREIADLDFDHRTGKIDEEDYREQREEYLEEAASVLRELDEPPPTGTERPASLDRGVDDEIEREVRRLRARARRR